MISPLIPAAAAWPAVAARRAAAIVPHGMRRCLLVLILGVLVGTAGLAQTAAVDARAPLTATSARDVYRLSFQPLEAPVPMNASHAWHVRIATKDGVSFVPGHLGLDGGMPAHGHGLPSEPRFTRHLGGGTFLLEGVLFNMAGHWQLAVTLSGPEGLDTAVANLEVSPDGAVVPLGNRPLARDDATFDGFSPSRIALIDSLNLANAPPPADDGNPLSGNRKAVALGARLFADAGLSGTGEVSCASCHVPERGFTDGRQTARGSRDQARNTPTLIGAFHQRWLYWDGRRDTLWAQALTPLETSGEMDATRTDVVRHVGRRYGGEVVDVLPDFPRALDPDRFPPGAGPFADAAGKAAWHGMDPADRALIDAAFVATGRLIAAYEQTLRHGRSRFDDYADALVQRDPDGLAALSAAEKRGLRLFLDVERTQCLQCHNGPLFTNGGFHNIGTGPDASGNFDYGRAFGLQSALFNPFNCLGPHGPGAESLACAHVRFAQSTRLPPMSQGAFKVPGLRTVSATAPYGHDGRFPDLRSVMDHYLDPPDPQRVPHELRPLELEEAEIESLIDFLGALSPL